MKSIKRIDLRVRREILAESKEPYLAKIQEPRDLARIAQAILKDTDREFFLAIPVDVKNRLLGYVEVARGSVDSCPMDPREVFRVAVVMGASGVFLIHNHPSGDTQPSSEDLTLTRRIEEAGGILGIMVPDHIIVTENDFFSFAEHGLMEGKCHADVPSLR
jgi:DNA repair protein RadC